MYRGKSDRTFKSVKRAANIYTTGTVAFSVVSDELCEESRRCQLL
jgi:hypothetical protein